MMANKDHPHRLRDDVDYMLMIERVTGNEITLWQERWDRWWFTYRNFGESEMTASVHAPDGLTIDVVFEIMEVIAAG